MKQENDWKELPVDMLVLGFHFFKNFDYFEVMRGLSGVGDYHLKPEFSRASIPSDELVLPNKLITPSEIIEYLKQEQTVQTILAHPQNCT
jgi:hypothetical protein